MISRLFVYSKLSWIVFLILLFARGDSSRAVNSLLLVISIFFLYGFFFLSILKVVLRLLVLRSNSMVPGSISLISTSSLEGLSWKLVWRPVTNYWASLPLWLQYQFPILPSSFPQPVSSVFTFGLTITISPIPLVRFTTHLLPFPLLACMVHFLALYTKIHLILITSLSISLLAVYFLVMF